MKVLVVSPQAPLLIPTIQACGDVAFEPEPYSIPGWECHPDAWPDVDFVVLFNYRHIVKGAALDKYRGRIINIHTSVLPFNRGAHPNFWSWFDGTPKGVSIHRVDEGIDTGELLACIELSIYSFRQSPITLTTSYADLIVAAAGLFKDRWGWIRKNPNPCGPVTKYQTFTPTFHKSSDIDPIMAMLPRRWDTPVIEVETLGEIYRGKGWEILK